MTRLLLILALCGCAHQGAKDRPERRDASGDVLFRSVAPFASTSDDRKGRTITGTDGDDTLVGGDGPDVISGGGGDDVLIGDGRSVPPMIERPDYESEFPF